jgi:hypothetical protein
MTEGAGFAIRVIPRQSRTSNAQRNICARGDNIMEPQNSRGAIAEIFGGTGQQRGVKLGIVAGCVAIFLLFGASALQKGNTTVNLESGQLLSLVTFFLPGLLAIMIAAILAYYAGMSGPDAKSGNGGRDGAIAGSITMLLFWVGQTLYVVVDGMVSPQGLALSSVIGQRFLAALLFFVIGGVLGWGGSRAAARRARSILAPPSSSLINLSFPGSDEAAPISPSAKPADTDISKHSRGEGEKVEGLEREEAPVDAPGLERDL